MDETLILKREALLSLYQHFDLNLQSYYNNILGDYKFYVFNLFHKNSTYSKQEILDKLEKYIYNKNSLEEISKAIPKNKSSKTFKFLIIHTNSKMIYKYYSFKNKVKNTIKG